MIKVRDNQAGKVIDGRSDLLMLAGFDPSETKFMSVGVTDDGYVVILTRCGRYSLLDQNRYQAIMIIPSD